jgi:hypothetical protein
MGQSYDERTERVPRDDDRDAASRPRPRRRHDEPDVLLDVDELRVDEIALDVEDLTARVSLQADVADLLHLHVGVDATLGGVHLTIKGVEAQVLLKARLDNVARIIDRVLTTIDNNPQIIGQLTEQVGQVATEVGADTVEVGDVVTTAEDAAIAAVDEPGRATVGNAGTGAKEIVEDLGQGKANTRELADEAFQRSAAKEPRYPRRSGLRRPPSSTGGSAKGSRRTGDHGSEEG